MTAFVLFQSGNSYEFHVGTGKQHKHNYTDVVSVQVDGHELEQAEKLLGRKLIGRVYTLVGDSAKEVIANWPTV